MSTDKVLFEIGFSASSVPAPTTGTAIQLDMVRCQMEMNTQDNRFWVATLTDGYYTKDAYNNAAGPEPATELADNNNWKTPFTDNDPLNRWCDPANTATIWSEFQCKSLSCYLERDLNTGDSTNDIAFTTSPTLTDMMVIDIGRAKLWFNKTSYSIALAAPQGDKI